MMAGESRGDICVTLTAPGSEAGGDGFAAGGDHHWLQRREALACLQIGITRTIHQDRDTALQPVLDFAANAVVQTMGPPGQREQTAMRTRDELRLTPRHVVFAASVRWP